MASFSSKEIEGQYNLIKIILTRKTNYAKAIEETKKDIKYMLIELKKSLKGKYLLQREKGKDGLNMISIL